MTFPGDRHPDYYEGARAGAEEMEGRWIGTVLDGVDPDEFAAARALARSCAAINAAEQAMRAAQEQAMAPQEPTTPGARYPLADSLAARFPQGDGEAAAELPKGAAEIERLNRLARVQARWEKP
jgi:hypothetical protein